MIGDIGHCVRRYNTDGSPTLQANAGDDASPVWHKDIVLEDLGNIAAVHRISEKIDRDALLAEDVMSSSLLFVANAFDDNGDKVLDETTSDWITDLILFDLEPSYDDTLDGGPGDDVCIGQRGDDKITGGLGNDLLIGDAGTNVIPQDMNLPRVYQVYRTMDTPEDSDYVVATDYGALFTYDFELYPNQYRQVDSLASIIDSVVTIDDVKESSNLVQDILGVSALSTEPSNGYCMQPMFRVTPGYLKETQWLLGNDVLESGGGEDILIGTSK